MVRGWVGWEWEGPIQISCSLVYPFPLLVPSRLSLSLPSGERGVMGRRKTRERDDLEILCRIFPSHHPLRALNALREDH